MTSRLAIFALFLFTALASGCGDTLGSNCEVQGDCDDDLVCAAVTLCAVGAETCPGICFAPCESDADCSEGGSCETQGNDRVCVVPSQPGL